MSIARHPLDDEAVNGASDGHTGRTRADGRKQGMLRAAVTATVTGLALAVPLSPPAQGALSPTVLQGLHLDSATLAKVKAYDRYRTREASQREKAKKALRFARKQIGKPYRWGADGPSGYDCSGLAMASWRRAGVKLPRVTYAQYRKVDRKVKYGNLERGDLIFFHGRSHVGLYVGHGRFLHAPHSGARVRIDKISARRRSQFAGAVRPGAPAYQEWSASVRGLVEKIDRMSAQKRADQKPPDKERNPQIPPPSDTLPEAHGNPPVNAPAHTPAKQAAPPGGPAPKPDDSAAGPPRGDTPPRAEPDPRPRVMAPAHRRGAFQPSNRPGFHPWAEYVAP
ncbi:NlpC/P60 family protein [Actinomadura sp. GTD37]|uniref:C40 family peptidase n=1 Tax=Actinomadura sp. GTD37 TaxID=1778030 RepID=UPI0035C21A4B